MNPPEPHKKSRELRRFRPSRKRGGIFAVSIVFADTALTLLVFFLLTSPFVMQPGINIRLPASPFSGGARFDAMVLSVTHDGWYFFNDERCSDASLEAAFRRVVEQSEQVRPLIIEADERVSHAKLVTAWNAALAAGIKEVSIATRIAGVEQGGQ